MLERLKAKKDELARKAKEVADAAMAEFEKIKLPEDQRNARLEICRQCPSFFAPTTTCTECGCFMNLKTYVPQLGCPLNKWIPIEIVPNPNKK